MLTKITSLIFNAAVVLVAVATAVWLTITGQTLNAGGLLTALGAILGAVMFGFRLSEGFGPDRLSIWVGPLSSVRRPCPSSKKKNEFREAA